MVDKNLSSDFYSLSSNYYDLINMDKDQIKKLYETIKSLFDEIDCSEEIHNKLKDLKILDQYENIESLENVQIGMILYRTVYYFNLNPIKNKRRAKFFIIALEDIKKVNNQSKNVMLYFVLNYSRGLLDNQNHYVKDFYTDFDLLMEAYKKKLSFQFNNYPKNISDSDFKSENKNLLDRVFKFFYETISKSIHFKNSINKHIKYLNINSNADKFLDSIPSIIFSILEEDSGVLGTVIGNEEIIIQINHLNNLKDNSQKNARLLLQIIHELGHHLVRFYNGYLSFSPRRTEGESELKELEAGYLLEYYVFGSYNKQIWTSSKFYDKIFEKELWNNYNLILDLSNIGERLSNFNTSGIEQYSKFSSKE